MICKKCPSCGQKSYSAANNGKWYCPYCGRDLRPVKFDVAPVSGLPAAAGKKESDRKIILDYLKDLIN